MSEDRKNEEVIEEQTQSEAPKAEAEAPKEEKKEKPKKEKGEKKKEEKAEPKAEKAAEAPQGASDAYLRLLAEYDNYRKRSQREKDALYADIRADTLKSFLPVYDNLMRALNQSTADEAYRKGVEMIMAQFNKTLEGLGVERIESLGKTFDPALHNAVMHVDDETKGENEIVEVFQEGFRLGDKVIRFAMVKVAN